MCIYISDWEEMGKLDATQMVWIYNKCRGLMQQNPSEVRAVRQKKTHTLTQEVTPHYDKLEDNPVKKTPKSRCHFTMCHVASIAWVDMASRDIVVMQKKNGV